MVGLDNCLYITQPLYWHFPQDMRALKAGFDGLVDALERLERVGKNLSIKIESSGTKIKNLGESWDNKFQAFSRWLSSWTKEKCI